MIDEATPVIKNDDISLQLWDWRSCYEKEDMKMLVERKFRPGTKFGGFNFASIVFHGKHGNQSFKVRNRTSKKSS